MKGEGRVSEERVIGQLWGKGVVGEGGRWDLFLD